MWKIRGSKGFRAPRLRAIKRRAPGLQNENVTALGLHIICLCFRAPGSTVFYNSILIYRFLYNLKPQIKMSAFFHFKPELSVITFPVIVTAGLTAISYLKSSFLTAQAWRNERLSKVPLQDRYWLVWKAIQMAGSKIPKSSMVIHLKAGHAQLNRKSAISGLQIGSFQDRSFHDRWSRGTKTLGTRVETLWKPI